MRIGSVYTVAVLLGIGALALPTAKPNGMLGKSNQTIQHFVCCAPEAKLTADI